MWKFLNFYKIAIPLILLSTTACSSDQRYHCKLSNLSRITAFDIMAEVYKSESGQRVVFTDFFGDEKDKFIQTSDKDNVIVTTYKESSPKKHPAYRLFKIDMSSSPVIFNYGFAYHNSIERFERRFQLPYTEKNFNSKNLNPEIVNYIPPKEQEQHISFGFWREDYDCGKPLNLVTFKIKKMLNKFLKKFVIR